MPTYIARFELHLKAAIRLGVDTLPALTLSPQGGYITSITIEPTIKEKSLRTFLITAECVGALSHLSWAGQPDEKGVIVHLNGPPIAYILPEYEIAGSVIAPMLGWLSATTLQAHVYWDLTENLSTWVKNFSWQLPDGKIVPPCASPYPQRALWDIPGTGEQELSQSDWSDLQQWLTTPGVSVPPLWRVVLAEAHRERNNDIRNVVVRCATALDLGIYAQLPPTVPKFGMDVLRGGCGRIPDLRISDQALHDTLAKLWYTRHAIVHKGQAMLYDRNPQSGAAGLRPLTAQDTEEFLVAVPKGVSFVETKPY